MWKTKTKKEDPHNLFPVADVSFQANNCRVVVFHGGVVASWLECTNTDGWSEFGSWLGTLFCILGQDILLS